MDRSQITSTWHLDSKEQRLHLKTFSPKRPKTSPKPTPGQAERKVKLRTLGREQMSFSTTYLTPTSIERDLELTRATTHQRSSGSIYTEDMYLAQKMESDPREFYVDENRDLAHESGAYMMDAEPGAKQPRDRMRLNRILNNGTQVAE